MPERKPSTWIVRAIAATNGTQFGAIIHEALRGVERLPVGSSPDTGTANGYRKGPRFIGRAYVTSDGFVMCDFVDQNENFHNGAFVGSIEDLDRKRDRLARHLGLNITDTRDLTNVLESWIGVNWTTGKGVDHD